MEDNSEIKDEGAKNKDREWVMDLMD